VPLVDYYGEMGELSTTTEVKVHGAPKAWVFKDTASGKLTARICGECGHAELHVTNFRELYEKYAKSRQSYVEDRAFGLPATERPAGDDVCLSCGQRIPPEASQCPACGWTWGNEGAVSG
jgi:hypothetical protein